MERSTIPLSRGVERDEESGSGTHAYARCGRRRASLLTRAVLEGDWGDGPCRGSTLEKEGRRDREGEKESRMKVICRYSKQPQKREKHRQVQDWKAY